MAGIELAAELTDILAREPAFHLPRGLPMLVAQLAIVLAVVCVHLFAGNLRFIASMPRSRWLSFAGGTSVAYVFLHLLPELFAAQEAIHGRWGHSLTERVAYLAALVGIVFFYGLERLVAVTRSRRGETTGGEGETSTGRGVFWIHVGSFAFYNFLIGYLLVHEEDQSAVGLALYGIAIGFHFLVNDFALREDHKDTYRHYGRWLLAGAVASGWVAGIWWSGQEVVVSGLFAFLAGGIVLNVLKEELPESRRSRFLPFALGAAVYSALMLFI